jgi:hypothetical protein
MGRAMYEIYDPVIFEGKIRVDMMYYEQLFQKLEPEVKEKLQESMAHLFTNIRKIYECINIKPEIYGKGINEEIIDESIEHAQRKLSKAIYENLDKNFYRLNEEQRQSKYYEICKGTIKDLMAEGMESDSAVSFSIKTAVIQELLKSIAFPFSAWTRTKHLMESVQYAKVFDQDRLINLVESFEKKIFNISKIIATCV